MPHLFYLSLRGSCQTPAAARHPQPVIGGNKIQKEIQKLRIKNIPAEYPGAKQKSNQRPQQESGSEIRAKLEYVY